MPTRNPDFQCANSERRDDDVMTVQTTTQERGIRRCAVCKIDLRGRFVLVNDEAERLFGLGKDQLFGRPLSDFLDEDDQQTIQQILRQRNHYESFFETTSLILRSLDGSQTAVRLILSLNYINGNPVNYQIVIQEEDEPRPAVEPAIASLEAFLSLQLPHQWQETIAVIGRCCGAHSAACYVSSSDGSLPLVPEPIAAWSATGHPGELTAQGIHQAVAETGIPFDCTAEPDVRQSIERRGVAPHELLLPVFDPAGTRFLFRANFSETTAADTIRTARQRAERLLASLDIRPAHIEHQERAASATKPAPEELLATAILQANGSLHTLSAPLQSTLVRGADQSLSNLLAELLSDREIEPLEEQLLQAVREQHSLTLDAGSRLVSLLPAGEATGLIVLLPHPKERESRRPASHLRWKYALLAASQLESSLSALRTSTESLLHRYHEQLSGDGELLLKQQESQTRRMQEQLHDISLLAGICAEQEASSPVNPSLIIQEQLNRSSLQRRDLRVTAAIPHSTVVSARRKSVTMLVAAIFAFLTERAVQELHVQAIVETSSSELLLRFVAERFPISQRQLHRAFHGHRSSLEIPLPSDTLSLTAATVLAQHLGGELGGQILPGEGSSNLMIRLAIPLV